MKNNFPILLLLLLFYGPLKVHAQKSPITIPKTTIAPEIDGLLGEEWKDALSVVISGSPAWDVTVYCKYDEDYIYFAFKNLISPNEVKVNPDVLINTNLNNSKWEKTTFWFHSSYSNCDGNGEYYTWENCSKNHPDWKANTFPYLNGNNNIEYKISWSKLHIAPNPDLNIGIAFKISDVQEKNLYWPESAIISNPATWGTFKF